MQAEITICTLDQRDVETSNCYRILVQELGQKAADRWTEVITVPLGADDT